MGQSILHPFGSETTQYSGSCHYYNSTLLRSRFNVQVNVVRSKKITGLNLCSNQSSLVIRSAHAAWVWQIVFGTSEYFELVRFVNKTCSQGK